MKRTDRAGPVRTGEELEVEPLEAYLTRRIPGLQGPLAIHQFPSGFSNLTYLLRFGNRDLVLRRPPAGTKAETAHDMQREYKVLKALKPYFDFCPEPLFYTDERTLIGSPFYVMERIRGIILRKNLPEDLHLPPRDCRRLCHRFVEIFTTLHQIDYAAAGLQNLGKPQGYAERQVRGWSRRYRNARTADAPGFEGVMDWLATHMPPDPSRPAIIHNDFRFDNVVLDENDPLKIIGVLDWEMATIGDPLMDLGNSLAYWIQADDPEEFQLLRLMPTHLAGMLTRRELVESYARMSERATEDFAFYSCFGLFRLAVIAQQIYYRYFHGQTQDERFKMLIFGVHVLEKAARRVIAEGFF
ncbi:MAG: phosphotransferase family protein [Desulfosarcina sp.]|nr:phosphotransferase family protein [Desulfobacterales bacterium]